MAALPRAGQRVPSRLRAQRRFHAAVSFDGHGRIPRAFMARHHYHIGSRGRYSDDVFAFLQAGVCAFRVDDALFRHAIFIPKLVETYTLSSSEVPFADLLLLANAKEQAGDIAGAIRYSDLAEKAASDASMKAEIHKKLLGLQSSLVNSRKPTVIAG